MPEPTISHEPLFERIVDRLHIPNAFLARYSKAVRANFREAAVKLATADTQDDGINHCLHLASSFVLRNPEYLDDVFSSIRRELGDTADPPTVLTVSAVYYLLQRELKQLDQNEDDLRRSFDQILQGFDKKDWLIGPHAMKKLEIEKRSLK